MKTCGAVAGRIRGLGPEYLSGVTTMHSSEIQADGRHQSNWRECHGEVGHLVRHLKWRRRTSYVRQGTLVGALAVVVICSCFYSDVSMQIEVGFTGSKCDYYCSEMQDFYCNRSRSRLMSQDFLDHLDGCPDCRRTFSLCKCVYGSPYAHVLRHRGNAQSSADGKRTFSLREYLNGSMLAVRP
jgi:hypothetical protein